MLKKFSLKVDVWGKNRVNKIKGTENDQIFRSVAQNLSFCQKSPKNKLKIMRRNIKGI